MELIIGNKYSLLDLQDGKLINIILVFTDYKDNVLGFNYINNPNSISVDIIIDSDNGYMYKLIPYMDEVEDLDSLFESLSF